VRVSQIYEYQLPRKGAIFLPVNSLLVQALCDPYIVEELGMSIKKELNQTV
jgi:hypothetical protein